MDCDQYFDEVVLLLHNDSFAFADSSTYDHIVQLYPSSLNVLFDSVVKKFGAGSANFPFGTSTMVVPDGPEFDFSTGDWTVELWAYLDSGHAGFQRPLIGKRAATGGPTDSTYPYRIRIDDTGALLSDGTDSGATSVFSLAGGDISAFYNTWAHIALTRFGSVFTLWFNGASAATATNASAIDNSLFELLIGGRKAVGENFGGQIDDVRLTKGIARYTAPFTPPTVAFEDRACRPNDFEPARWIRFGRALRLPHVLGGEGKFQNERTAIKAFVAEAQGDAVFARYALDSPNNDSDIQVDITHAAVSSQPHDSVER